MEDATKVWSGISCAAFVGILMLVAAIWFCLNPRRRSRAWSHKWQILGTISFCVMAVAGFIAVAATSTFSITGGGGGSIGPENIRLGRTASVWYGAGSVCFIASSICTVLPIRLRKRALISVAVFLLVSLAVGWLFPGIGYAGTGSVLFILAAVSFVAFFWRFVAGPARSDRTREAMESAPEPATEISGLTADVRMTPEDNISETTVRCSGCGYNLTGAVIGRQCPECGVPVEHALRSRRAGPSLPRVSYVMPVLMTIFCCVVSGIVSVVYTAKANTAAESSDVASYESAMSKRRGWMIANAALLLIFVFLQIFAGML